MENFNPRSREGSDKGQTFSACPFLYFNPRSREGSDTYVAQFIAILGGFQSTLPRRERQTSGASIQHFWNFNPRSREGSDYLKPAAHGTY